MIPFNGNEVNHVIKVRHAEKQKWLKNNERPHFLLLFISSDLRIRSILVFIVWIATALVYYGLVIALSDQVCSIPLIAVETLIILRTNSCAQIFAESSVQKILRRHSERAIRLRGFICIFHEVALSGNRKNGSFCERFPQVSSHHLWFCFEN